MTVTSVKLLAKMKTDFYQFCNSSLTPENQSSHCTETSVNRAILVKALCKTRKMVKEGEKICCEHFKTAFRYHSLFVAYYEVKNEKIKN